jgi:L-ascorbate metabolism protein UlaG (beta-lactamase superfamily)
MLVFVVSLSYMLSVIALKPISLRYLESNSWLLQFGALKIAIDPVLSGPLDFGAPVFYSGTRRIVDGDKELENIAESVAHVLISQGFDDHAHTPTLKRLRTLKPSMNYICPPSAVSILKNCGIKEYNIKVVSPGENVTISSDGVKVDILATQGALLGPPWQAKENGYIIKAGGYPSLYYEPHCMYSEEELSKFQVDCVITPIVAQRLPGYTLVDGDVKALDLCKKLKAKVVIPMANGELVQSGLLSQLLITKGAAGVSVFESFLLAEKSKIKYIPAPPGKTIDVKI